MRKTILYTTTVLLLLASAVSCQDRLIQHGEDGLISVFLEKSPELEIVTRAEGTAVDINDFMVYINSASASFEYLYADIPNEIVVPMGVYTVSAENVSVEESLSLPDNWGQARFYGVSEPKKVDSNRNPTTFSFRCNMANAAVTVRFDDSIEQYYNDFKVTVYADADTQRKLEYFAPSVADESSRIGYFSPGTLRYEFTGTHKGEQEPTTIKGSIYVNPATKQNLTFEITSGMGMIGDVNITVNTDYVVEDETVTVDPETGEVIVDE